MKGYFISEDKAKELELLQNSNLAKHMQKTVIVITKNDFQDERINMELDKDRLIDFFSMVL